MLESLCTFSTLLTGDDVMRLPHPVVRAFQPRLHHKQLALLDIDYVDDQTRVYGREWSGLLTALSKQLEAAGDAPVAVSVGLSHTVALSARGKVFSWGCNDQG